MPGGTSPFDQPSHGFWGPGPVPVDDIQPVWLGNLELPLGPRSIQFVRTPNVVEQVTRNAVILWDYGFLPTTYVLEGYANRASLPDLQDIIAQFGSNPLIGIRFIAPSLGLADLVRYVSWTVMQDQSNSYMDPHYELKLSAAGTNPRSILSNGRVSF